ncbi:hypothetical protein EW146_g2615 [Bondarzewia mesenterica]|uniref:NADP-dependent oxidoreductase domain-containing protein n=1 Tax=Bondarzewia mesenterica TaxID=1095465 RepID=A0A4S4M028_9AGAM|nr:hypothetical protein EW146_g2615 [Bondarzewia mesenterica]
MSAPAKKMPYVRLGNSGLKVSKLILGTMQYGDPKWQGWVLPEEESMTAIKAAYDAGIQTFDTADTYSNGLSEVALGKAIKKYNLPRDEIVVISKCYWVVGRVPSDSYITVYDPDGNGYVNQHGNSRKHIFDAVKKSLERLQLDYIDVLLCHRFDPETPIAETMHALNDVVKAGYARYIGMSSCWAYQYYALANNLTPFICMQNHYSLLYREEEREMMPALKMLGVSSIPWSPLARGFLTRPNNSQVKTKRTETDPYAAYPFPPESGAPETIGRVEEIAKKKGVSMAQIAVAWILAKDPVAAPVVGPTSIKSLLDLAAGVHVKLTDEEVKYLEGCYKSQNIIGH